MHWLFQTKQSPRQINHDLDKDTQQYPPTLEENDFLTIIKLEDRYNYYKSLIKVQQLNHINEDTNQKNMLKIMTELIEYYAQCITQAERNVENIVKYFQHKIKYMNNHYLKVFDKQKIVEESIKEEPAKHNKQLGNIEIYIKPLEIPEPECSPQAEDKFGKEQAKITKTANDIKDIKSNLNKNLMMALQSQNIQEHLNETNKKADFLKKSIANSIQMQEEVLERRLREGKKKKIGIMIKDNVSNANTTQTNDGQKRNLLRRSKSFGVLHSDSELDEAESLYIENFVMEEQMNIARAKDLENAAAAKREE